MGKFVFFGMFFFVGVLFTLIGWSGVRDARKRLAEWTKVEGTVTGFDERPGSRGKTLYAPRYAFRIGGEEGAGTASTASSPPDYEVGDAVRLLVNPANLLESVIVDKNTLLFSWGFFAAGAAVLAISFLILWAILAGKLA